MTDPAPGVTEGQQSSAPAPVQPGQPSRQGGGPTRRSKLVTFVFALVPGAGHMYLGLMQKGLQIMIFFFGTLYLSQELFFFHDIWPLVFAPVTWFYSLFDSMQIFKRLDEGEEVADMPFVNLSQLRNRRPVLGWSLIVIGCISLVGPVFESLLGIQMFRLRSIMAPLILPLAIVGAGAYLLWGQARGSVKGQPNGGEE